MNGTAMPLHPYLRKVDQRLNTVGGKITLITGTMWVAIGFACLSFISLPAVLSTHDVVVIVAWVTQSFLQLVLLPVIIVGQNLQGQKTEARDIETHDAVMAEHADTQELLSELKQLLNTEGPKGDA